MRGGGFAACHSIALTQFCNSSAALSSLPLILIFCSAWDKEATLALPKGDEVASWCTLSPPKAPPLSIRLWKQTSVTFRRQTMPGHNTPGQHIGCHLIQGTHGFLFSFLRTRLFRNLVSLRLSFIPRETCCVCIVRVAVGIDRLDVMHNREKAKSNPLLPSFSGDGRAASVIMGLWTPTFQPGRPKRGRKHERGHRVPPPTVTRS